MNILNRQRGPIGKGVIFTTTLIERSGFNPHPGHAFCPWISRFTMIISAWWLQTSSKFSGQEFEEIHRNIGSSETPKQVRIPPSIK